MAILDANETEEKSLLGFFKKRYPVKISTYLDSQLFSHLNASSRDDALKEMVDALVKEGKLKDKEAFYQAILKREEIVSTGIGMGVAIPHAKMKGFSNFFIAVGIQQGKGLEWHALDKAPVKLIFMIGGPENRQTEYLQLLSKLTFAIKNEELRKKLLSSKAEDDLIRLFDHF